MDEASFEHRAHEELQYLEDRLGELDPDDADLNVSAGVLRVDLRDGTKIVINSHRAAGQIWMAAVATAWHFDPRPDGTWVASRTNEELRATLAKLLHDHLGLALAL